MEAGTDRRSRGSAVRSLAQAPGLLQPRPRGPGMALTPTPPRHQPQPSWNCRRQLWKLKTKLHSVT